MTLLVLLAVVAAFGLYYNSKSEKLSRELAAWKDNFVEERIQKTRAQERAYALQNEQEKASYQKNIKAQEKAARRAFDQHIQQQAYQEQVASSIRLAERQANADIEVEKALRIAEGKAEINERYRTSLPTTDDTPTASADGMIDAISYSDSDNDQPTATTNEA
jgi:hypothetical protein